MRIRDIFNRRNSNSADNPKSYDFIKSLIDGYAERIDAPKSLLPTYGYSQDFARPYIKIDKRKIIHFVVKERGKIIDNKTADLKHFIYWVFEGVTASTAQDYELSNRIDSHDSRRLIFKKQKELLGKINTDYQKWIETKHEKILLKNPFIDSKTL